MMKRPALCAAVLAAVAITPTATSAQWHPSPAGNPEQRQAAFAGATLRLVFGHHREPAAEARLGIGLSRYPRDDASGAFLSRGGPALPIEAGLAGRRLEFFVGGQSVSQIERRLGAAGSTTTMLLVLGGVAAGALAVALLIDDEENDGPCPPGVEVCTQ